MVLEQCVDGEERVSPAVLKWRGIGGKHIEHAALERGAAAAILPRAGPVLVLAGAHPRPSILDQKLPHVATLVEIVAGFEFATIGLRRGFRAGPVFNGLDHLVQPPGAAEQTLSLLGRNDRQDREVTGREHVPVRRGAQEHPALATGLDERGDGVPAAIGSLTRREPFAGYLDRLGARSVEDPLDHLHVAADRLRESVHDVATARRSGLDDQAVDQPRADRGDTLSPRLKRRPGKVEVDHLKVARHPAAHDAQVPRVREPPRVLR